MAKCGKRFTDCACKGVRTCLQCEKTLGANVNCISSNVIDDYSPYFYCTECDQCWPGYEPQNHTRHTGDPIHVNGVYILNNFLNDVEQKEALDALERLPWEESQSGRRKQNFGPKCNFKKKKCKVGNFNGFPSSTKFIQEKLNRLDILKDFITIEQCSLEYDPERGASIDPHIDDCWVWGERIVTVNVLGDSTLTLTPYEDDTNGERYNLRSSGYTAKTDWPTDSGRSVLIRLPMPEKSLMVLTGEARYQWEHRIFRDDISSRRVCVAYREFTPDFLPGGKLWANGEQIIKVAANDL